jgi:hypothetical protein
MRSAKTRNNPAKSRATRQLTPPLQRELNEMRALVTKLEREVAELQNWAGSLVKDLKPGLINIQSRLEQVEGATRNLFVIVDRDPLDGVTEQPRIKTGLSKLVDQGGATPVNSNAARISGGMVVLSGDKSYQPISSGRRERG